MKFSGTAIRRAAGMVAATLGLTLLALPAGVSHAAASTTSPAQTSPFVARIVQGPDGGAVLSGALSLTLIDQTQLRGSLVVGPVTAPVVAARGSARQPSSGVQVPVERQSRPLTNEAVVPVTGEVLPVSHTVLLTFDLGHGRTMQTRLQGGGLSVTAAAGVQTTGPQHGDVGSVVYIHIHIQGDGWSIDIYIGKI